MGFQHVDEAGLELLNSGDLLLSTSQSARIIGLSHCAQPSTLFIKLYLKNNNLVEDPCIALVSLSLWIYFCFIILCYYGGICKEEEINRFH